MLSNKAFTSIITGSTLGIVRSPAIRRRNLTFEGKATSKLRSAWAYDTSRNYATKTVVVPELNSKMEKVLRLSDYDCIGFDLDNTLGEYQLFENSKLEYELLANYLVDQKGYDGSILLQSFESGTDFILRGLMLDTFKGNILKIACDGSVLRACHGSKPMSEEEIEAVYGKDRKWDVASKFVSDPLSTWEGPVSEQMRTLLDYFDAPASLVFARAVDSVDKALGKRPEKYPVWSDLIGGLFYLYSREHFELDKGGYFPALKADPPKYVKKCNSQVVKWLKELKKTKKLFVITGSNVDYASFTGTQALGENWRDLFDVVVFYSRKPGFFTGTRPFLKIVGIHETDPVSHEDIQINNQYSQGNWQGLYQFFSRVTGKSEPKCLYIGDNLLQDIFTPSKYANLDTIALSEEVCAESDLADNPTERHEAESIIRSNFWGSYFYDEKYNKETFWSKVINQYSKVCIPNILALSKLKIDYPLKCFTSDIIASNETPNTTGYFPYVPTSLQSNSDKKDV